MKKRVVFSKVLLFSLFVLVFLGFSFGAYTITKIYNYTAEAVLNNTKANNNFLHLEINNSVEKYSNFNGLSNNYIGLGNINAYKIPSKTISAWIYRINGGTHGVFSSANNNYFVAITGTQPYINYANSTESQKQYYAPPNSAPLNQWNHIVWVYDVNESNVITRIYVNGNLVYNNTQTDGYSSTYGTNFVIGAFSPSVINFNGSIDDLAFFNRALNQTEIQELYNLGRINCPCNISGIVSLWDFDNNLNDYTDKISGYNGVKYGNVFIQADESLPGNHPYGSLVAYWSFDGDTNNISYDLSGNNLNSVYYNGLVNNNSCSLGYGNCLTFDGVNDYLGITNTAFNISTFSASLWVYIANETTNNQGIVGIDNGYYNGWRCVYLNTKRIVCQFGRGSPNTPYDLYSPINSFQANNWNHLVVTRNVSGNVSIYINGNFSSSGISTNFTLNQANFRLGVDFGGISYLNGSIDEFMFFNKALTPIEVQNIYNNQSQRFKNNGTATLNSIQLNETGNNLLNWKINSTQLFNTKIYGSIGECNNQTSFCGNNTANYTFKDEVEFINGEANFTINTSTTNILPRLRLESPGFYTPYIFTSSDFIIFSLKVNFSGDTTKEGNFSQDWIYAKVEGDLTGDVNITLWNSSGLVDFFIGTEKNFTNLQEDAYFLNATIKDIANQTFSTETRKIILDRTPPTVFILEPTNNYYSNSSSNSFRFNLSDELSGLKNISLRIYNSSDVVNTTFKEIAGYTKEEEINISLNDGEYLWYIDVYDTAENSFVSQNYSLIIDTSSPKFYNLTYTPSYLGEIDPNTTITFTINATDERTNISSVILEIRNETDSQWYNFPMNLIEGDSISGIYQYNFTTSEEETNYTFRIFANDSSNNINRTQDIFIRSEWDCTWNLTIEGLTGSHVFGFNQIKEIGNITFINDGDKEYKNNSGCYIKFSLEYNSTMIGEFSWTYISRALLSGYYPGLRFNQSSNWVTPFDLVIENKTNLTLPILGVFPSVSSPLEESPVLRIDSNITDTLFNKNYETIKINMTIAQPGAYLRRPVITESKSGVIYLTTSLYGNYTNYTFYTENMGGTGNENFTAYNVTLNWSFPSSFVLSSNSSRVVENMTYSGVYEYLTTEVNWEESIKSLEEGVYKVCASTFGYKKENENYSLIQHANDEVILENCLDLFVYCYSQPDGVCISSCTHLKDPDCPVPQQTSAGGSGGGSGSGGGKQEKSEAQFELVIGKQQEFILPIKNKYPQPLTNLKISVAGINSEFIEIVPKEIERIEGNKEFNLTIKITAPAYFKEGNYTLRFKIDGFVQTNQTKSPYTETKLVTLYFLDLSREDALKLLEEANKFIEEMNKSNLYLREVLSLLEEMKKNLEETKFSSLKRNYEELKLIYESALEALKLKQELELLIKEAKNNGIKVMETEKTFFLAEAAFNRGAFKEASEKFKQAKLTYAVETKGEFNLYYYVKNNPLRSASILASFLVLSYSAGLLTKRALLKRKLKLLKQEELLLLELMKTVQRECFELGHMSIDEYQTAMAQYEERLGQCVEEEIRAETSLAHLGKIKGKKKALNQEKERLTELIKKTQEKYLVKGEMDTRVYYSMIKSYSRRLTQVEEELASIELKEWMRR
ncbi:MAG: LamG-like jellyroll fold domain-containing protein [Candidatus Pacearchaeota archaeon]